MSRKRIIPCLLLDGRRLVKTEQFKNPKYVGDPINAVRIFNDKFVDEIIFLDISASRESRGPDFDHIREICHECFIPFCYGGGIRNVDDAKRLFEIGVEKVSLNSALLKDMSLVSQLADRFGSQSIVAAMDVKRNWLGGYSVMSDNGSAKTDLDPFAYAADLERQGVGEILVNSVDRDGTMKGYDLDLFKRLAGQVSIPVIGCGGAGELSHIANIIEDTAASAAAAGSLFVFKGKHRAVLINYPDRETIKSLVSG